MKTTDAKHFLMLLVAFGFFAVIGTLLFVPVPTGNKEMLQMLLMPLAGVFGFLVGYKPERPAEPKP